MNVFLRAAFSATLAVLLHGAGAYGSIQFETHALTGDQAPGTGPGVHYSTFFAPVINSSGQVSFKARLTGVGVNTDNNLGLWSERSAATTLIARTGNRAPETPERVVFRNITGHNINDAGQTAFRGQVTGVGVDGSNDLGIWSEGGGAIALIAREGSPAPGAGPGAEFGSMNNPLFNNAGEVAFRSSLQGTSVSSNNLGIWSEVSGPLTLHARRLTQVTGMTPGLKFDGMGIPVLNSEDGVAFYGELEGTGVSDGNDSAIWLVNSGIPSIVVREGDAVPGTTSGAVFSGFFSEVGLNDAGQTAFMGAIQGTGVDSTNRLGMWMGSAGAIEQVWRQGDLAPGTPDGVVFDFADLEEPVINQAGDVAFRGTAIDHGANGARYFGIWSGAPGTLELVALTTYQVPGAAPGVSFGTFLEPVLNGAGQTAFAAIVIGAGVNGGNDRGIWATDRQGNLTLVVREGETFDVNDDPLLEDLRTISEASMIPDTGGEDGRSNPFNDLGQLAFRLKFTDGTEGVFVANVPEPSSVIVFSLVGCFTVRRGCRQVIPDC